MLWTNHVRLASQSRNDTEGVQCLVCHHMTTSIQANFQDPASVQGARARGNGKSDDPEPRYDGSRPSREGLESSGRCHLLELESQSDIQGVTEASTRALQDLLAQVRAGWRSTGAVPW